MSQITWMAKRLQELELIVSESRSVVDSAERPAPKLAPSPVSPESTSNSIEAHGPAPELPDLNVDANGRVGTANPARLERAADSDNSSLYIMALRQHWNIRSQRRMPTILPNTKKARHERIWSQVPFTLAEWKKSQWAMPPCASIFLGN